MRSDQAIAVQRLLKISSGRIVGDLVNLNRFRKRVAREQSAKAAESNRARHGRTKAERELERRRADRANAMLDQHRIDSEDAS